MIILTGQITTSSPLHVFLLSVLTLLLVTYCAEVTLHTAYGCVSEQATTPDVHAFQICPRSKYW